MLVNIIKTGQNTAGTAHATAVFSEPPPFAVNGESFDFGLEGGAAFRADRFSRSSADSPLYFWIQSSFIARWFIGPGGGRGVEGDRLSLFQISLLLYI